MDILVTGGSGLVGGFVVEELLQAGHRVTVLDRVPPQQRVPFIRADILRLGDLTWAFEGQQAIIHLAAIPNPLNDPPQRIMETNVMGTFNVLEAAAQIGVPKVVIASTDSALGFVFATHGFSPEHLPIDEQHPLKPQDPYGLSKAIDEEMCRAYTDRYRMATICVRICFIWDTRTVMDHRGWVEDVEERRQGIWVYTDARDAAQAFRLAAEAQGLEHEAFFVPADDGMTLVPTAELIERYFASVPVDWAAVAGDYWSLISNRKAKELLGYQPQYSWRQCYDQEA
jgi:nucleoside-diphosphate-sugar epimerase